MDSPYHSTSHVVPKIQVNDDGAPVRLVASILYQHIFINEKLYECS